MRRPIKCSAVVPDNPKQAMDMMKATNPSMVHNTTRVNTVITTALFSFSFELIFPYLRQRK